MEDFSPAAGQVQPHAHPSSPLFSSVFVTLPFSSLLLTLIFRLFSSAYRAFSNVHTLDESDGADLSPATRQGFPHIRPTAGTLREKQPVHFEKLHATSPRVPARGVAWCAEKFCPQSLWNDVERRYTFVGFYDCCIIFAANSSAHRPDARLMCDVDP